VLRGTFSTMSVVDLLEWIERRRITGRLMVEGDSVSRSFTLDTGAVVWATSTEPTEQLGTLLRSAGHVDDISLATSMADRAGPPLGARLVERGVLGREALRTALLTKIREALCDVLSWRDGAFDVAPGPAPAVGGVRAVVSLSDVLALAARRAPRWPAIRAAIPDEETGFRRTGVLDPAQVSAADPALDDLRLLAAVDAGRGVRAIIAALGGERFAVLDRLTGLLEAGALELAAESAILLTPAELVADAERLAAEGAWAPAMTAAAQAFTMAPDNPVVGASYRRIERAHIAGLARRLLVTPGGRPPVPVLRLAAADLEGRELGELERRMLHAVDGRWDLLTLVQHAPVRPAEALAVFARLVDRGIVELA
jgi:hypothetical protein